MKLQITDTYPFYQKLNYRCKAGTVDDGFSCGEEKSSGTQENDKNESLKSATVKSFSSEKLPGEVDFSILPNTVEINHEKKGTKESYILTGKITKDFIETNTKTSLTDDNKISPLAASKYINSMLGQDSLNIGPLTVSFDTNLDKRKETDDSKWEQKRFTGSEQKRPEKKYEYIIKITYPNGQSDSIKSNISTEENIRKTASNMIIDQVFHPVLKVSAVKGIGRARGRK